MASKTLFEEQEKIMTNTWKEFRHICRTCHFWKKGPDQGNTPCRGECRRYPPQALKEGNVYPLTSETEWCGGWKPAMEVKR